MTVDPLYRAIEQRLDQHIDADTFERCAAALIRVLFPTLVLVPGGSDAGMDGYAVSTEGNPFVLVSTTSPRALENLRKNLRSYVQSGGRARTAVFATSQPIGGRKRINLENEARNQGFTLLQVFEQAWFADALYRAPTWRIELLGLGGDPPALSRLAPSRRASLPVTLVDRDTELGVFREANKDLVVIGLPGIGKTAVLGELTKEGWGLFIVDQSIGRIADALRGQEPPRVILDDAHFHPSKLVELRRLRDEIGASFAIVAVTWPGHIDEVTTSLPNAALHQIRPLSRDSILKVIKQVGVMGPPEFQRELVDQARGRAGLAATLALLALQGSARAVATGEALLRDMKVAVKDLVGEEAGSVLGLISLSGSAGVSIERIADTLRLPLPTSQNLVRGLASGGIIEEKPPGSNLLVVQPEDLRYAAVKDIFFSGPGSLPLELGFRALDDRSAAIVPLVGAAHRGATVDDGVLRGLAREASDGRSLQAYASLGQAQAEFALSLAPEAAIDIAKVALRHSPKWAYRVLMERGVDDNRDRPANPEHPLRIISDHVRAGGIEERRSLLEAVEIWLQSGGNGDVGLEALTYALSPAFETHDLDPGQGSTVTFRIGLVSLATLQGIIELADRALPLMPPIDSTKYQPLFDLLWKWAFPGVSGTASDQHDKLMRGFAARYVRELAIRFAGRNGLLARLSDMAHQAKLRVKIDVASDFRALFPARDGIRSGGDWRAVQRRQSARALRYAKVLAKLPPEEAVAVLAAFEKEAGEANITYPRLTPVACGYLADKANNPDSYGRALVGLRAPADLIPPFIQAGIKLGQAESAQLLEELLADDLYRTAAIVVCLSQPVGEKLQAEAVRLCDERLQASLEILAVRGELRADAIPLLLDHPNLVVASSVATELRSEVEQFSESVRKKWEAAIVRCPADETWYPLIMSSRPELLAAWVEAWIQRQASDTRVFEPIPKGLLVLIGRLSLEQRHRLLLSTRSLYSIIAHELVTALVGEDDELVDVVFSTHSLDKHGSSALAGEPDAHWLKRARTALAYGWKPERIAWSSQQSVSGWLGDESNHWDVWVEKFRKLALLRESSAQEIGEAGVRVFSELRDRALTQERHEAIYGRG